MTKKIVVADDEESVRRLVAATLGGDDRYELFLAADGDEALNSVRRERPDLIFLDVVMPIRDGYQVCREIKNDPATKRTKVIMLTALAQESDRQKALEAGVDGYFTKPFSPIAILEEVEAVLEGG